MSASIGLIKKAQFVDVIAKFLVKGQLINEINSFIAPGKLIKGQVENSEISATFFWVFKIRVLDFGCRAKSKTKNNISKIP